MNRSLNCEKIQNKCSSALQHGAHTDWSVFVLYKMAPCNFFALFLVLHSNIKMATVEFFCSVLDTQISLVSFPGTIHDSIHVRSFE